MTVIGTCMETDINDINDRSLCHQLQIKPNRIENGPSLFVEKDTGVPNNFKRKKKKKKPHYKSKALGYEFLKPHFIQLWIRQVFENPF